MKLTVSNANISNTLSTARITLANTNIVESITLGNVSVTPSQITIGSATITPTTVSVPTLVLGGSQFSGGQQGGIINYQEFTANGTWYNPYANASVNASLTGYEQVLVMAWGGGGGGTTGAGSMGGGGGAFVFGYFKASQCNAVCNVVVGAGGSKGTSANGISGNNSIFWSNSTTSLIAYGGGGALNLGSGTHQGGGGGGWLSAGISGNGGGPLGGTFGPTGTTSTFGGGGGANNSSPFDGGASVYGGGGGGGVDGGISVYGGGGGGGGSLVSPLGGNSIFGGKGGSGGGDGLIPGGGGGANSTASGNGARGEVRVWVFGPAGTTAGAPTYALTANTTDLYEDSSVLYTVSTTNVANGTTLYYTLNNSSTAVATDFTTAVNGSVVINGGTGTFTLTANNDTDSANEAFQIDVRTGNSTGTIVASNNSVSIIPISPRLDYVAKTVLSLSSNANTSLSIQTPTGTQSGDIILAVSVSSNRPDGHTSTDFTQWFYSGDAANDAGSNKTTVLYKILSGIPASNYTFTIGDDGYGSTVYLALFTFRPVGFTPNTASFGANYSKYTTYQSGTTITANQISSYSNGVLFRLGSSLTASDFTYTLGSYELIDKTITNNPALLLKQNQNTYSSVPDYNMTITSGSWQGASFIINTFQ